MPDSTNLRVPAYRHHKPPGLASVRIEGRDIYLGPHGTAESRAKYKRVIAEWLANHKAETCSFNGNGQATNRVVDELIAAYLDFAKSYYVKNGTLTGEYRNIGDALRPLTTLYGRTRVADFGPSALKAVRQAMMDADLCRRTINSRINRIRQVLKWGVENELVPAEVLHALQAVAPLKLGRCNVREADRVKPVPKHLIEPVRKLAAPQVAAMIRLQLLTGMRSGEVMQMRACDIDMGGPIWVYRPLRHKTEHHGRQRVIYLGPKAQDQLRPFLPEDRPAWIFSPREARAHIHRQRGATRQAPMTPSQAARKRRSFNAHLIRAKAEASRIQAHRSHQDQASDRHPQHKMPMRSPRQVKGSSRRIQRCRVRRQYHRD